MHNNVINRQLNLSEIKKLSNDTEVRTIEITIFAQDSNIKIERSEIFSFVNGYGLITKKSDGYKTVSLKNLLACQKVIKENYEISKKHNIKQTLIRINKWIETFNLYIDAKNDEIEQRANKTPENIELSVFSLIERKHKTINFNEAYQAYKTVYCIPIDKTGCIKQFKRYLDLNYLKIDEKSFFQALS